MKLKSLITDFWYFFRSQIVLTFFQLYVLIHPMKNCLLCKFSLMPPAIINRTYYQFIFNHHRSITTRLPFLAVLWKFRISPFPPCDNLCQSDVRPQLYSNRSISSFRSVSSVCCQKPAAVLLMLSRSVTKSFGFHTVSE